MTRRTAALTICLGLGALCPSAAGATDDGIVLLLSHGATPDQVVLQWTGGQPTFEVFRSITPNAVVQTSHKLGETNLGTWNDPPAAGGILYYVVTGGLDRVPPEIAATLTPAPNAAGWNNTDVQVAFQCSDAGVGIAACPGPVVVTAEGAGRLVTGTATDQNGNSASATATINLDKTQPVLNITAPVATVTGDPAPTIRLQYSDTTSLPQVSLLLVSIDGTPLAGCSADQAGASCVPPNLTSGAHTVAASLADVAGNGSTDTQVFSLALANILAVRIDQPATGLLTNSTSLVVSGTVSNQADSVIVNGVIASVQAGAFTAMAVPIVEGSNTITAVATNSAGDAGTSSITVVRDTSPPTLVIESPAEGQVAGDPTLTVTGLVNDVVTGTISAHDCQVTVSGRAGTAIAMVDNRTFQALNVPLVPGPNTLTAVATDAAGNSSAPFQVHVVRQTPAGQGIREISGNHQAGIVASALSQPLVVGLFSATGTPVAGRQVTFRVSRGDGSVGNGVSTGTSLAVQSDQNGLAQVQFMLGRRSGLAIQRVSASALGFAGQVEFEATANTGSAAGIKVFEFDHQSGVAEQPLPRPFTVFVHDQAGNPVSGVPVSFQVTAGGGSIAGSPVASSPTDADGRTQVVLTLGPGTGINNNSLKASIQAPGAQPAVFTSSGYALGPRSATRVSGVVLDNSNLPMPGVMMRILGTGLTAVTDAQGQFVIDGAPVASIKLEADGTTTTRPGVWPMLRFDLTTISGQDNTIGMPIYLVPIDTPSGRVVGGSQDVTLTMTDVPGVQLTVLANSVTCLDGSHQCLVSISQVHNDKVPMPPLEGVAPSLIWTVQPPGTLFNPPARITYPNVDRLRPGAVTEVLSFDHDLGQYVSVGTATVSADGSVITSDPGGGIAHAGWGYPRPDPPPITCAPSCPPTVDDECFRIVSTLVIDDSQTCEYHCFQNVEPKPAGTACQDDGNCCTSDVCSFFACSHPNIPDLKHPGQLEWALTHELCIYPLAFCTTLAKEFEFLLTGSIKNYCNGPDGVRHSYLMCCMTTISGVNCAESFGFAHERDDVNPLDTKACGSHLQDLNNNELGIRLGLYLGNPALCGESIIFHYLDQEHKCMKTDCVPPEDCDKPSECHIP